MIYKNYEAVVEFDDAAVVSSAKRAGVSLNKWMTTMLARASML